MISRVQNIQKLRDKLLVQRNTTTRHRSFFLRSFKSKKNTSKNWRRPFNFHFSFIRMRHFSIFIFLSKENSNLNLGLSNLLCACANWFVIQGRMRRMIELKRGQNKTQVELSCFSYQRQSRTRNTTHTKEEIDWNLQFPPKLKLLNLFKLFSLHFLRHYSYYLVEVNVRWASHYHHHYSLKVVYVSISV